MGHGGGYRALHRPCSRLEYPADPDRKPHHDQPPEAAKVCEKQKYSRHRRLRQRQDAVLCQTVHHADVQLLCHHRSKRAAFDGNRKNASARRAEAGRKRKAGAGRSRQGHLTTPAGNAPTAASRVSGRA